MQLSKQQAALKHKQVCLDNFRHKSITIVGLGGLGTHISETLVRMGFDNLRIIDGDVVESSNLSRQVLYTPDHIGEFKSVAAKETLQSINPDAIIDARNIFLEHGNIEENLLDSELILDGNDNLQTRYLINDYCFTHNTPWIYAAAIGTENATAAFIPEKTPCFECVYGPYNNETSESCDIQGILPTTLMDVVSKQVNLALQVLAGKPIDAYIYSGSVWEQTLQKMDFSMLYDDECSVCNEKRQQINQSFTWNIICGGIVKDIRTNQTAHIESIIQDNFNKKQGNRLLTEYQNTEQRIVVYHQHKISFYGFSTDDIKRLIN